MVKYLLLLTYFIILSNSQIQQSSPCVPLSIPEPQGEASDSQFRQRPRFCSAGFEIYPSVDFSTSHTVEILYVNDTIGIVDDGTAVFYSITFTPKEADCISPTLSFTYYDIDNERAGDEWIIVNIDATTIINCGFWKNCTLRECFNESPIPSLDVIPINTDYTVVVSVGDSLRFGGEHEDYDTCLPHMPEFNRTMIAANLTLNCAKISTSSPTSVTIQPSVSPTTESAESCDCDDNDGDDGDSSDELYNNQIRRLLNIQMQQSSPCIPFPIPRVDGPIENDSPRFCSAEFEIYPSVDFSTSQTVEILYVNDTIGIIDDLTTVFYSITFTPKEADCISPTLSFTYYDIDNDDADDEWLIVLIDATTIKSCGNNNSCTLRECFDELPIPSLDVIPIGTPYTVLVASADQLDFGKKYCWPHMPEFNRTMIAANLTLNCAKISTSSPTSMTLQPSVSPTADSNDCDCDGNNDHNGDDPSSDDVAAVQSVGNILNDNKNEKEEQIVVSFSKNSIMNIWGLVICFMIVNLAVAWCCCFKSKKPRITFKDQVSSKI